MYKLDKNASDQDRNMYNWRKLQTYLDDIDARIAAAGGGGGTVLYSNGPSSLTYLGSSGPPYTVTQTFGISYSMPANTLAADNEGLRITLAIEDSLAIGSTEVPFIVRVGGSQLIACRRGNLGVSTEVSLATVMAVRRSGNLLATGTIGTGQVVGSGFTGRAGSGLLAVAFGSANTIDFQTELHTTGPAGSHTCVLRWATIEKIKV